MNITLFRSYLMEQVRAYDKFSRDCRKDDPDLYPEERELDDWLEDFSEYLR